MSNTLAGIGLGSLGGMALILAAVATGGGVIGEASTVGLKEAVGLGVSSCGLVWWVGRKFQSIEDSIQSLNRGHQTILARLDSLKREPPPVAKNERKSDE